MNSISQQNCEFRSAPCTSKYNTIEDRRKRLLGQKKGVESFDSWPVIPTSRLVNYLSVGRLALLTIATIIFVPSLKRIVEQDKKNSESHIILSHIPLKSLQTKGQSIPGSKDLMM